MTLLGTISLNISLILYLFLYLPQLIHNLIYKRIKHISLSFHALLFIAATADFYYGFGRIHQWQYQWVAVSMFTCLLIQHIQLCIHACTVKQGRIYLLCLSVLILIMLLLLPFALQHNVNELFIIMGWIERLGYWLYSLPQLIKNHKQKNSTAVSPVFIIFTIITSLLDTISAWSFSWGSPSLYGAPLSIALHSVLLYQWFALKNIQQSNEKQLLYT